MSIGDYLNVQRAALFEKWLELHDMIQTIDEMVRQTNAGSYSIEGIHQLATHLHHLKAMRKGWEDRWHFDKQADTYDRSIKKAGHTFNIHASYDEALAMVVDEVNVRPNDIVLDIGIGTGNLGAMFLEKGATVIGVDQSDKMLATCHQKHPAIETRKGHFLALPLVDQQVDAIVSSYALHHLPDHEKLLAFQEMHRVLKPNGQICIADLMFIDGKHREKVIEKYRESGNMEAILSIEDEYFADQTLLTTWLRVNGFHVREHRFHGFLGLIYARRELVETRFIVLNKKTSVTGKMDISETNSLMIVDGRKKHPC
ncbi:class I SAM-dependent methyltransferase [Paracerasibacillus soli]|uniref:Class I SAM-dependent methyltransferase n=1 Tax=Paracerasibacillus soli TaxID=480284 RepID=A0ABU5CTB3_9BACI|nr:class I SAM-dependent methyltransferase [Virgibacillus soli]MDY0409592.1 class I SAM-dependent methyltransferase [Virgibacillus soli]